MAVILQDNLAVQVPEFQFMYVGDAQKQKDFDKKEALSHLGSGVRLIVDIDSTHSGTSVNGRCYPARELRRAIPSWTKPYRRAFLSRHPSSGLFSSDDEPNVLGRVLGGRFFPLSDDLENDWVNPPLRDQGSGYVMNPVLLTDKDAVERVVDERLFTVSVGMASKQMVCPFCNTDWVPSMKNSGEPPEECEHRPGELYKANINGFKGKMPFYFVTRGITYDHIAETYKPAQPYASVKGFRVADSLGDLFLGETLKSSASFLALCDEEGHVVRLGGALGAHKPPPLTDAEAITLACMMDAGVLDTCGEYADGYDTVDLQAAVDRITSSGEYQRWQKQTEGRPRLGLRGALPVVNDEFATASWKFFDRYMGSDKQVLGFKLLANSQTQSQKPSAGGKGMTWDEIVTLSEQILDKIQDVPEDGELCDTVLKEKLDADLFAKVDYSQLTDEQLDDLAREDLEWELRGVGDGSLDAEQALLVLEDKRLTTKERKGLSGSTFCGPNRSFPVPDASHARAALQRLAQGYPKGASAGTKARIRACVVRKAKKLGVKVSGESKNSEDSNMDVKELEAKIATLEKSLADAEGRERVLQKELEEVQKSRDEALKTIHDDLAKQVLDLRVRLGKPGTKDLSDEKRGEYLEQIQKRSAESLVDSLEDLRLELEEREAETDTRMLPPTIPIWTPVSSLVRSTTAKGKKKAPMTSWRS